MSLTTDVELLWVVDEWVVLRSIAVATPPIQLKVLTLEALRRAIQKSFLLGSSVCISGEHHFAELLRRTSSFS